MNDNGRIGHILECVRFVSSKTGFGNGVAEICPFPFRIAFYGVQGYRMFILKNSMMARHESNESVAQL